VVAIDPAAGGDSGSGAAAANPAGGPARSIHPSPTRPDNKDSAAKAAAAASAATDPNWFDASGLGGLLGFGTNLTPAPTSDGPAAAENPPADVEAALAGQDHRSSPSSVVLLGASLLILLALVVGVAVRWWSGRSARYWPA
jgi:hypothetical protein